MTRPGNLLLHHARRMAKARRDCCRAYDELLAIYDELEDAVETAHHRRSFAPIARLFSRAEAAETRYVQAKRIARAAQDGLRESDGGPVLLDLDVRGEAQPLH